jgi:hypothetical protein
MFNSQSSNQLQTAGSVAPTANQASGQQAFSLASGSTLEQAGLLSPGGRLFSGSSAANSSASVLDPVALTAGDFVGNTRSTAYNIGDLNNFNFNWNDSVSSGDRDDFFRFSMTNAGTTNFSLSGLSADADIYLYNSSGTLLSSSTLGGTSSESLNRFLSSGTYYLQVHSYNAIATNYHLTASGAGPAADPGNAIYTSHDLGNVSRGTRNWNDSVGSTDTRDWFHVQLSENGNLNLSLSGLSADADVALYDRYGTQIALSNRGGTFSESISRYLNAGDYYVQVYQFSGNTNYRLDLSTLSA